MLIAFMLGLLVLQYDVNKHFEYCGFVYISLIVTCFDQVKMIMYGHTWCDNCIYSHIPELTNI